MTVKDDCPGYCFFFWLTEEQARDLIHVSGLAVNISVSVRELRDGSSGKNGARQTSILG